MATFTQGSFKIIQLLLLQVLNFFGTRTPTSCIPIIGKNLSAMFDSLQSTKNNPNSIVNVLSLHKNNLPFCAVMVAKPGITVQNGIKSNPVSNEQENKECDTFPEQDPAF